MGGAVTGGASLAGYALSAIGSLVAGEGQQAAAEYKAESLERAAEIGKVKAVQTSADLTQRLNTTLGNIDTIRAAAHDDPTSPTGGVVRDYQERLGTERRTIAVQNILEQSSQDASDAKYMRTAGQYAMLGGELGAGASLFKGIGTTDFSKFGFGSSGSS